MGRFERQEYLGSPERHFGTKREFFCILEIWEECLGMQIKDLNTFKSKELHSVLRKLRGWEYKDSRRSFPPYGSQRHFKRIAVKEKFGL